MNLKKYLDREFESGLRALGALDAPAVVKQASKPAFGHYQANGVMGAAKKRKSNPRELAQLLLDLMEGSKELTGVAEYEIAGPGFINITLTPAFIQTELNKNATDPRLGIPLETARKILIDYSSPNLAKEMHIGHLRSTAIGDANVRILEFLGHEVIRANHVGDWGAQFGSLLAYMDKLEQTGEALATELKDLEVFYQKASELFKTDEKFAARARQFVVRLQSGDAKCLALWERFIKESIRHCQAIYDLLDISLTADDVRAESAYNDVLASTIEKLEAKGLVEISDGAKCVFMDEFTGKDDKPLPAIVQKSDGGYPYMATDLAAAEYRGHTLRVDEALYFVDGRQSLHLSQLYAIASAAGFIQENQVFSHIPFGTILNKEGKPFKTRDGGAVKLAAVGEEAREWLREQVKTVNTLGDVFSIQLKSDCPPGVMLIDRPGTQISSEPLSEFDVYMFLQNYDDFENPKTRYLFRVSVGYTVSIQDTMTTYIASPYSGVVKASDGWSSVDGLSVTQGMKLFAVETTTGGVTLTLDTADIIDGSLPYGVERTKIYESQPN